MHRVAVPLLRGIQQRQIAGTGGKCSARNAGLLAVRMLAMTDARLRVRMADFQRALARLVLDKDAALQATIDTAPTT